PAGPPAARSGSKGVSTGPNAEFSFVDPIPNSSRFVLATTTPPAASRRSTTVAVYGGTNPSRILEPAVVGVPATQMLSLTATGRPARGESGETVAAAVLALSSRNRRKAFVRSCAWRAAASACCTGDVTTAQHTSGRAPAEVWDRVHDGTNCENSDSASHHPAVIICLHEFGVGTASRRLHGRQPRSRDGRRSGRRHPSGQGQEQIG